MSIDRSIVPEIQQATNFTYHLPPCETHELTQNVRLYSLNAGTQQVVSFEMYLPRLLQFPSDVVVSKAFSSLLKSGTRTRSAKQINEEIEQLGASLSISQNNDFFIIKLQSLTKHFAKLLPLLIDILQNAQFPTEELEIYRKQAIQNMMVNLKKSDFTANRLIDKLVYGFEHPYGSYSELADFEKLTREDVLAFYKKYFNFSEAKCFLSGKFSDEILDALKNNLSSLNFEEGQKIAIDLSLHADPVKKHRVVNDEGALQGAIRISQSFIDRDHPDFTPMLFTNSLFGGYFGSRLMSNIREDKGYTYGIYSFVQQNMQGNSYVIATDVGKDVAEKAVEEVWAEMQKLRTEPVAADELQLVKNYILGTILGSIDGPFKIMNRWKSLILNGQDASYFNAAVDTYKNISSDKIMELANTYYQQDDFYDLIVY